MDSVRFIMVGGFLGAGKTTTLARLAEFYVQRGQRVALVTNDQAQDLVDTHHLRAQQLPVAEVAGACFCCRFDDLICQVEQLINSEQPNVILAEPVGSCADLVATVVQPLKDLYGERFQVAPYPVVFKPSHGWQILRHEEDSGFSPKAVYLFRKQLEEADAILINRMDELSVAQAHELAALLAQQYPGIPVLRVSAKTGQGFDALTQLLDRDGAFGRRILDIDYDTYAAGEAELGWLNSSVQLQSFSAFELDALLLEIVTNIQKALQPLGAEVAHLKAIGLWMKFFGVANLVSSRARPVLSIPSKLHIRDVEIIVNARVAIDPVELQEMVEETLRASCLARKAELTIRQTQSFRPGRPTPTHRYTAAK